MVVFLTGATGLIGSHLTISLLNAGHRVVVLARGRAGVSADARVRRTIAAYPGPQDGRADGTRLRVVEGDLLHEGCGLGEVDMDALRGTVDAVVHSAGEVLFSSSSEYRPLRANTDGVTNLAGLASSLACGRLVHISTAYVDKGLRGMPARSEYETTKLAGEQILARTAAERHLGVCVIRPSVVTGDRVYGFAPTFNGIYPFFRYAVKHWKSLRHVPRDQWLPGDVYAEGSVNLLPVDYVAAVILAVLDGEGKSREINVVNPVPWRIRDLVAIVHEYLAENSGLAFEPQPTRAGSIDAAWVRTARMLTDTYGPYLNTQLDLHPGELDRLVAGHGIAPVENTKEWIHALLRWSIACDWKGIC